MVAQFIVTLCSCLCIVSPSIDIVVSALFVNGVGIKVSVIDRQGHVDPERNFGFHLSRLDPVLLGWFATLFGILVSHWNNKVGYRVVQYVCHWLSDNFVTLLVVEVLHVHLIHGDLSSVFKRRRLNVHNLGVILFINWFTYLLWTIMFE